MKMSSKYIVSIVFVLMVLLSRQMVCCAQDSPDTLFRVAGDYYKEGKYRQAIQSYETILGLDSESAALYFNLANSYFKNGNTGKAVVNYERAKRLAPRDSDLLYNLNYVLDLVQGSSLPPQGFLAAMMKKFIDLHTRGEMFFITVVFFIFSASAFLGSLYRRSSAPLLRSVSVLLALVTAFYLLGIGLKNHYEKGLSVIIRDAQAKYEPREDGTIYFSLNDGSTFKR